MCEWGTGKLVWVKIPHDLSATGAARWKYARIDHCISDIVEALQEHGIDMRGSCCGHGELWGNIHLQDGRVLLIVDDRLYWRTTRLLVNMLLKWSRYWISKRLFREWKYRCWLRDGNVILTEK